MQRQLRTGMSGAGVVRDTTVPPEGVVDTVLQPAVASAPTAGPPR